MAGRAGERMLQLLELLTSKTATLTGIDEAVAEGFKAALLRMVSAVLLIGGFSALAGFYNYGAGLIERFVPLFPSFGSLNENPAVFGTGTFLWLLSCGGVLLCIVKDVDHKWPVLNWLLLGVTASAGLTTRSACQPAWLLILMGQTAGHYFIHAAAVSRRRKAEWLSEQESIERRASRPKTKPGAVYRGVAGFDGE